MVSRTAGVGSLGRQRFVALGEWRGGRIAREAKALVPSAANWANGSKKKECFYEKLISRSVRCLDPSVHICGRWIVRRLAPDCSRIELSALSAFHDQLLLLESMGFETGNVHLGTAGMSSLILRDLKKRKPNWLSGAAKKMTQATR